MEDVIDLTDDSPQADKNCAAPSTDRTIGAEMSADVVDLFASDDDDETEVLDTPGELKESVIGEAIRFAKQSHPRKILEASSKRRKRLKEEAAAAAEAAARESAKRRKQAKDAKRAAARAEAAVAFNSANIPGGCNFIVIDSDTEDDGFRDETEYSRPSQPAASRPNINRDTSDRKRPSRGGPSWKAFDYEKNYSYNFSQEAAQELQERLFQEAAARVRSQNISVSGRTTTPSIQILSPEPEIAEKHPDHWTWKDPYSCLGLPRGSSLTLVKSHYRKLARLYHPDKSKHSNCVARFHAIATAYRKLTCIE